MEANSEEGTGYALRSATRRNRQSVAPSIPDNRVSDKLGALMRHTLGSIVAFELPDDWVGEFSPEGAVFFPLDSENVPTLRVSVITARSPSKVTPDSVADLLKNSPRHPGVPLSRTSEGLPLVEYAQAFSEEGAPLTLHSWEVGQPVPPRHARIIVFALTTDARDPESQGIADVVRMAVRSSTTGAVGQAAKPWWQFW